MARKAYKKVDRVKNPVAGGTPIEHVPPEDFGYDMIPKERYTSEDYMRREWSHMWSKVWLLAGLSHDLEEAGDYICTEIGTESVIVIRQKDVLYRRRIRI